MTQEIKEWAHKEFRVRFSNHHIATNSEAVRLNELEVYEHLENFIDFLIDRTVRKTEERIVGIVKNTKQKFADNERAELMKVGYFMAKQQILDALITNKSYINSGMPHPFTNPEAVYGSNINKDKE